VKQTMAERFRGATLETPRRAVEEKIGSG